MPFSNNDNLQPFFGSMVTNNKRVVILFSTYNGLYSRILYFKPMTIWNRRRKWLLVIFFSQTQVFHGLKNIGVPPSSMPFTIAASMACCNPFIENHIIIKPSFVNCSFLFMQLQSSWANHQLNYECRQLNHSMMTPTIVGLHIHARSSS